MRRSKAVWIPWMHRALELARRGKGWVEPNPMVGAVVVRGGRCMGEGVHLRFGGPHAEVEALARAGRKAAGATLVVSLEPCCHHGKTPPCTEAILHAGIRRVVFAARDPFGDVKGRRILRRRGVQIIEGILAEDARRLNAPFFKAYETGFPYVIAKWAMSLDGKVTTRSGQSRWISSEKARQKARELRGRAAAVMVGIGTVLADDPGLRAECRWSDRCARIVVDSRARIPLGSRLVRSAAEVATYVAVTAAAPEARLRALERAGCRVIRARTAGVPSRRGDSLRVDLRALGRKLVALGIYSVFAEGGPTLLGQLFDKRLVDEIAVFVAPRVLGGERARSPVEGSGVASLGGALWLSDFSVEKVGPDLLLRGPVRSTRYSRWGAGQNP